MRLPDDHAFLHGKKLKPLQDFTGAAEPVFTRMAKARKDQTFAEFLKTLPQTPATRKAIPLALSYVEGLDAADASRVSIQWLNQTSKLSEKIQGDDIVHRPLNGYSPLITHLAAGQDIRYHHRVTALRWSAGRITATVTVHNSQTLTLSAKAAIITLPPVLLQSGAIEFDPPLPPSHTKAIASFGTGPVIRILLSFDRPFWEDGFPSLPKSFDPKNLHFLHSRDHLPIPTFWTQRPVHTPVLTGWASGPAATALGDASPDDLLLPTLESLSRLLGLPKAKIRQHLRSHLAFNWQTAPFSRGAYTYGLIGSTRAAKALATPIQNTLFFAGEAAAYRTLPGTVDAAMSSALQATALLK